MSKEDANQTAKSKVHKTTHKQPKVSYVESIESNIWAREGIRVIIRRDRFDVKFGTGYDWEKKLPDSKTLDLLIERIKYAVGDIAVTIVCGDGKVIHSGDKLPARTKLGDIRASYKK